MSSADASAPGSFAILAEALWYATMLAALPFLIAGIITLFLGHKTRLRRNFAFGMGVLNTLIGIGAFAYWFKTRLAWATAFLLPLFLGVAIIYVTYNKNNADN